MTPHLPHSPRSAARGALSARPSALADLEAPRLQAVATAAASMVVTAVTVTAVTVMALMSAAPTAHAAAAAAPAHDAGHGAAPAKPAAGHGDAAAPKPAASGALPTPMRDPMATLREKLAARLGAQTQPLGDGKVVRVVAKSDSHGADHGDAHNKAAGGHGSEASKGRGGASHAKAHRGKAHAAHWDYTGPGAPEFWGALKPEYSACAKGERQSPIDIRQGIHVDLAPIDFEYEPSEFSVLNNGHTVQVNMAGGNSIEVMGRRYDLVQMHFHHPSEERINGRQFDMSLHMVHRDPEGRLAVVAVLLDRGETHPAIQAVWNNLPLERHHDLRTAELLDPSHLLPADRRYYTYMGSLTTPPCTEGVLWMVMQQPVGVDKDQIRIFSRLYPMNARPVQRTADRLIKASN